MTHKRTRSVPTSLAPTLGLAAGRWAMRRRGLASAADARYAQIMQGFSRKAIELVAENKIAEAAEQGKFDNLPGAGKPLPELDRPFDPDWWARKLVQRENLRGLERQRARLATSGKAGTGGGNS